MEIKELMQAGKFAEARKQLIAAVKAAPGDLASRTLLFQVLCYLGEWEKADRHLEAIVTQDTSRGAAMLGYRNMIRAEIERVEVFDNKKNASFISEPPDYLQLFLQLRLALGGNKAEEVGELLSQLESQIPKISGTVSDTPFVGLCDTDTSLFPFLEVITHERYLWVPFESIRELEVSKPESFLDLLWIAARITTWEGLTMNCFLPVLYPGSYLEEDEQVNLGRITDWKPLAGSYARGVGQHVYEVGGQDMAILELGEIDFNFPGKE